MHYVISDLHGEYEKYKAMLSLIHFKDDDVLYVLGDVVDRGKHPLKIIQDMMKRPNVIPLIGNHDYMCLMSLYYLMKEINDTNIQQFEDENHLETIQLWIKEGGQSTLEEFMTLSKKEREEIIDYLGEFILYEEVCVNNRDFVLVHAGLENFQPTRPLSSYELYEMIFGRTDYAKIYFKDKYLVTGHTPTQLIKENKHPGFIYKEKNHFAIDCGCTFGGQLAALCLETLEEFYV